MSIRPLILELMSLMIVKTCPRPGFSDPKDLDSNTLMSICSRRSLEMHSINRMIFFVQEITYFSNPRVAKPQCVLCDVTSLRVQSRGVIQSPHFRTSHISRPQWLGGGGIPKEDESAYISWVIVTATWRWFKNQKILRTSYMNGSLTSLFPSADSNAFFSRLSRQWRRRKSPTKILNYTVLPFALKKLPNNG